MAGNSATFDELVHVESGYRYWQCGDYGVSPENPPLAKLVAAFPVRHWQLTGFLSPCGTAVSPSRGPEYSVATGWLQSPNGPALLWQARAGMIVFPLALLALVFCAARSFFGYSTAAIAAILLVFEPTLVAFGSLATTDMAFATCMFGAIWAAYEYAAKPLIGRWVLLGLAMGLALATKFLALSLPLIVLLVILLPEMHSDFQWRSVLQRFGAWLGACCVAWVVLWSSYQFRYSALPNSTRANYDFANFFASIGLSKSMWAVLTQFLATYRLVPEAYVAGLATLKKFDASPGYFFGNVYIDGIWCYYPVALAIKLTVSVLALCGIAIASRYLWRANRSAMLTLLISGTLCLGLVMMGSVYIGVRHVLPVFPILVIIAAAGASVLIKHSRVAAVIAIALVAVHVVSSLASAPGQLSYSNEVAGGSRNLHKFLADSNLDWGQSDQQIAEYVQAHPSNCAVGWSSPHRSAPPCVSLPSLMDLFGKTLPPVLPDSFTGTVFLQPTAIAWTDGYLEFLRRKPDDSFANGSVLVYRGTFNMHALAAARHMYRGMWMLRERKAQQAVEEFAAADHDCPDLNRTTNEQSYATALLQLHRPAEAKVHFQKLLELSKNHAPFREAYETAVQALKKL